MEQPYQNREIDEMMRDIKDTLSRIEIQTTKHNGRLSKVERALLIFGTATGVMLATSGSEVIKFLTSII